MPKQKTHKGLAKRVKVTGTKKVKRRKSFVGHLLSSRSQKRMRRLNKGAIMTPSEGRRTLRALGM